VNNSPFGQPLRKEGAGLAQPTPLCRLKRFAWRNKTEAIMKSGGKVLLLRGLGDA